MARGTAMGIIKLPQLEDNDNEPRIFVDKNYTVESSDEILKPVKSVLDRQSVTLENYIGKNKTVFSVSSTLGKIQKIFQKKNRLNIDDNDIFEATRIIKICEKIMQDGFGIETVRINIVKGSSFESVPVTSGHLSLEKYKDVPYTEAMNRYTETIEDAQGIRFKDPDNKYLILSLGVDVMASSVLTDIQLTAIVFHEIGHSFITHNYGMSLGLQRWIFGLDAAMRMASNIIDLYGSVKDLVDMDLPESFRLIVDYQNDVVENPGKYTDAEIRDNNKTVVDTFVSGSLRIMQLVVATVSSIGVLKSLWTNIFSKHSKERTEATTKRIQVTTKDVIGKKKSSELTKILFTFMHQVLDLIHEGLSLYITALFGTLSAATIPKFLRNKIIGGVLFPYSHFNRGFEKKSDDFAKAFGLGPDLAEALVLLKKDSNNDLFITGGMNTLFNFIPGVRVITQSLFMGLEFMNSFASGYPTDRSRMKSVHASLLKDLNDPSIPKKLKEGIRKDIEKIEGMYNEYIDPDNVRKEKAYARAFFYTIFHSLLKLNGQGYNEKKKPSSPVIAMTFVDAFRKVKSAIPMLKPKEDAAVTEIIEQVSNESCDRIPDMDDTVITWESVLPYSAYDAIKVVTMESYFGKVQIVEDTISYIHRIRELLPKNGKIPDSEKETIRGILSKWGDKIASHFNSETAYVGLESCYNAYAVSFMTGSAAEKKAADNNKLVETPTGYRYASSDNMHIIMMLGIKLLTDPKLSDESIAAIMFHEIGHGFQQFGVQSVPKQRANFIIKNLMGQVKDFVIHAISFNVFGMIMNIIDTIKWIFSGFGLRGNKKDEIKSAVTITDDSLKRTRMKNNVAVINENDGNEPVWIIVNILGLIQYLLTTIISWIPVPGITSFVITLIYDPLYLVDLCARGWLYKKNKECELFADNFAMKYGLGVAESQFFYNMYTNSEPQTTEFPLLRMISAFNMMGTMSMLSALEEHPSNRVRIAKLYEGLEKEINDRNLDPKLKQKMKSDLAAIKAQYNDLISPVKNFKEGRRGQAVVWLFIRIFVKLKERAKTESELAAPIVASKSSILRATLQAGKESPDLLRAIGETESDFEERLDEAV
jgi:Zn-dependent protease with chaperone function